MAVKPFLTTGIALASAAAIVAGTPTVLPAGATTVTTASAPAPTKLSSAQYELTALSDITPQGLINAYINGWGDYIGGQYTEGQVIAPPQQQTDPYFPGINPGTPVFGADGTTIVGYSYNNNGVFLSGAPGVFYYLADNILPGNIDNYYFEAGGLPAAIYVAANEAFGVGSPPAVLAGLIFQTPPAALLASAVIGVASLLPVVQLGPLTVGGGILANQYFSGGLPAVVNYIVNSFVNPTTAAAATAAPALKVKAPEAKALTAPDPETQTGSVDTTGAVDTTPPVKVTTKTKTKVNNPLAELGKQFDNSVLKPTEKAAADLNKSVSNALKSLTPKPPKKHTTKATDAGSSEGSASNSASSSEGKSGGEGAE